METIKVVQNISLNKGSGMGNGLYNLSCCIDDEVSDWFDEDVKNDFMEMDDEEFLELSTELIKSANLLKNICVYKK